MSASTVTDAASAVRASATNAAALAATTTAASIRAAASLAPRNHQRHSDAISMHPSQSACVCACTLSDAAEAEHAALAAALAASEPTAAKLNALIASLAAF